VKVLIADDSFLVRSIATGVVEALGFEPIEAANGREALDRLREAAESFELVLLDWNMPELDGAGVLDAVQQDDRLKRIPILMVTAERSPESIVRAIQGGAKNYLYKPFAPEALALKILEALGRAGPPA
jgi:two-component system chemotaxis response regulator CheY